MLPSIRRVNLTAGLLVSCYLDIYIHRVGWFAGAIAHANKAITDTLSKIQQRMLDPDVAIILKADDFNWVHVRGMSGSAVRCCCDRFNLRFESGVPSSANNEC